MELFRIVGTIAIDKAKAIAGLDETTDKAKSTGEKVATAFNTIGQKSIDMGKKLAGVSAGAGMAFGAMINYASDTEEATNKVDVAFGKSSKEVKKFADTALSQFGIAKGSAMDMAALFGDMGTSMGLSRAEAAEMSTSLVGLAGDLASFKNIGLDQATSALNGIFTGETESLKSLGVVMTQTNLDAYALANGFGKTTKEMTQSEQVALRYAYVMDQTKNAQGDFARTGDSTANQLRKFKEGLKELAATFGEILLPIVAKVVGKANDLLQKFSECSYATKVVVAGFVAIASAASPVLLVFGYMMKSIGKMVGGFTKSVKAINSARVAVKNYQLATEGASLAAGVANGQLTKKQALIGSLSNVLEKLRISTIRTTAAEIANTLATKANTIATRLNGTAAVGACKKVIAFAAAHRIATVAVLGVAAPIIALAAYMISTGDSAEETAAKITAFADKLAGMITAFADELPAMIDAIMPAITEMVSSVVAVLPALLPVVVDAGIELFMALVDSLQQIIEPLVAALPVIIDAVLQALPILIPALIDAAVTLWMAFVQAMPKVISALVNALPKIVQAIKQGLVDACTRLWESMKPIATEKWNAIKNAITEKIQQAKKSVSNTLSKIKAAFSFDALISKVRQKFNNIKNSITQPINDAKSKVSSMLKKIKGMFPLSIGKVFSNLKLPTIKFLDKGKAPYGLGGLGRLPKLTIKWNAKGAIFDKPTIFATPQGLQGVGEAGKEAVAPIDTLKAYVAEAVASQNGEMVSILSEILSAIRDMDAGMYQNIEQALDNRKIEWNSRELGRFVKTYA